MRMKATRKKNKTTIATRGNRKQEERRSRCGSGSGSGNSIFFRLSLVIVVLTYFYNIRILIPTKSLVGSDLPTQNSRTKTAAASDETLESRRAELVTPRSARNTTKTTTASITNFSAYSPMEDGNNNKDKKEEIMLSRPLELATSRTTHTTAVLNKEAEEKDPSFSACLLIMDDNHLLIEWLAYHYTTLPLRRLIVAIDPRSVTSPLPVLERWKGRINYTLWHDNDFVGDKILQRQGCNYKENTKKRAKIANTMVSEENLRIQHWTWIHNLRQPMFMHACAEQLRKENRSWTMFIDSDEYLVINKFPILHEHLKNSFLELTLQREGEGRGSNSNNNINTNLWLLQNDTDYPPMTSLQMIEDIVKYNVTRNITSSRQKQSKYHLEYHKMYQSGCIGLPRIPVSIKDSTAKQMQNQIPSMYNASRFSTLRFRHISDKQQVNGKPIIDLSRVKQRYMQLRRFNLHGGIRDFCADNLRHAEFRLSFFLANHYPLSLEHYGFRKGDSRGRAKGQYEAYLKKYQSQAEPAFNTDTMVRGWVHTFVEEVGTEDAETLLLGVGELVGDHQILPNSYSSSLSYENCDHNTRHTGEFSGLPEDYFNTAK